MQFRVQVYHPPPPGKGKGTKPGDAADAVVPATVEAAAIAPVEGAVSSTPTQGLPPATLAQEAIVAVKEGVEVAKESS